MTKVCQDSSPAANPSSADNIGRPAKTVSQFIHFRQAMGYDGFMRKICLLLTLIPALANSAPLRPDLYKRIKKETGISLKDAFLAVDRGYSPGLADLQIFARRVGIRGIEKSFEDEISTQTLLCKRRHSSICDESVGQLRSQIDFLREQNSKFTTLHGYQRLYYCLLIFSFHIKFEILKGELSEWDANCSSRAKVNTLPCQQKLYETHILADIARDITQEAFEKQEKVASEGALRKLIIDRISKYEHL